MLRYDRLAFTVAMEWMKTACTELDRYEEEIRSLSAVWETDQAVPAPRHRLKRCLAALEEKETSLKLMQRKLETIGMIYERTEQRALEMAEETAPVIAALPEGAEAFLTDSHVIDNVPWTSRSTANLRPLDLMMPDWNRFRPIRPVLPFLWPVRPWVPHHPWFIPRRPVPLHWPPRRPSLKIDRDLLRRYLMRILPLPTGLISLPVTEIGPTVLSNRATAPLVRSLSIDSAERQQRRERISTLFRSV